MVGWSFRASFTTDWITQVEHLRYNLYTDPKIEHLDDHLIWHGRTSRKGTPLTGPGNDARQYAWEHHHPQGFIVSDDLALTGCDTHDLCVNAEHLTCYVNDRRKRLRGDVRVIYNPHADAFDAIRVCDTRVTYIGRFDTERAAEHTAEIEVTDHLNGREPCHKGYTVNGRTFT